MSENRIATTVAQGFRRLGLRGQPLVAAHAQLVQILRNRLGREHAELFARPNLDPGTGSIEWFTSRGGAVRTLTQLEPDDRTRVEALARQLTLEIDQLAQKLKREGPAAELASQMLSGALQRPPGDWTYEIGGKPVLIMWGHSAEKNDDPNAALLAGAVPTAAAATAVSGADTAPTATVDGVPPIVSPTRQKSPTRRFWWLWLLVGLLLLLLALRSCTGLEDMLGIRHSTLPVSPAIDDAMARQRELLGELDKLRQARGNGPGAQACVRVQPDAPLTLGPPTTDPVPPVAQVIPDAPTTRVDPLAPDRSTVPVVPGPSLTPDQPMTQGTPTTPLTPGAGGITLGPRLDDQGNRRAEPSPDGLPKDPADGRTDPDRRAQVPPVKAAPDAPPDTSKPMTMPPPSARDDKMDFLRGDWVAGPGLRGTTGRPIDMALNFDQGGKGQVTIRRQGGSTCVGPVDAQMRGGRLSVTGHANLTCDQGEPFAAPRFECTRGNNGKALCNGINGDNSTYEMDLFRGRQ